MKEKSDSKLKKSTKPIEQKTLPKGLVWLYAITSVIFIPAFYYKPAVDVTWLPKYMVLAILLLLFVMIFILLRRIKLPDMTIFRQWPVRMWSGFVVVSLLSIFVAIHVPEAFFDGIKSLVLLLFLVVTTWILISTRRFNPFAVSAILVAIMFAVIGYYQYFTHVFRQADLDMLYKINGLMSHKNIFAGAIYMLIPLLSYSILTATKGQRVFASVALMMVTGVLVLLQTRSIWLATMVFFFISLLGGMLFRRKIFPAGIMHLRIHLIFILVAVVIGAAGASLVHQHSLSHPKKGVVIAAMEQTTPEHQTIQPLKQRAASIFDTTSPNRVKRVDIWQRTFQMAKDYPLLGVGGGNWKVMVPNYYQPDPDESYYHNWRRPHNDFLWVFAEKGVPGLLLYLGFFITLLITSIRVLRSDIAQQHKLLVLVMIAGLGGYLVDSCFSFPYERIDLQIFMMLFVAAILWTSHMAFPPAKPVADKYRKLFLWFAALVLVISIWAGEKMVKAEVHINYAHYAQVTGDWETAIVAVDRGNNSLAMLDPANNPMLWYRGNANLRLNRLEEAQGDLERALTQTPWSVPVLQDLAMVHFSKKEYRKAIEILEEAIRIYPLNREGLKLMGSSYYALEQYDDALRCFYLCLTDQPNPDLDAMIKATHEKKALQQ
jgi:O-antigen ligase